MTAVANWRVAYKDRPGLVDVILGTLTAAETTEIVQACAPDRALDALRRNVWDSLVRRSGTPDSRNPFALVLAAACQEQGCVFSDCASKLDIRLSSHIWEVALRGEGYSAMGRPKKVDDPKTIELVRKYLAQHSNDTSKVVKIGGQFVMQRGLTRSFAKLWKQNLEIRSMLSRTSFYDQCRRHHNMFRKFKNKSDLCATCHKYDVLVSL